jgi:hypothetical protein
MGLSFVYAAALASVEISLFIASYDSQGHGGGRTENTSPNFLPLLQVTQPLPSNVCFSGSTVLVLRKYATYFNQLLTFNPFLFIYLLIYFISMDHYT